MRFSTSWLAEYVDLPDDLDELPERLSMLGLVVEDISTVGDDVVYDIDVPTNRPDAMNHVGLGRELAAATGRELRVPQPRLSESTPPAAELAAVEVRDPEGCPRYAARILTGVSVGPSPAWLAGRLQAIGLRPVNNVADATNYVLWELGHPLHAFDLDRLAGERIVVRRARGGETLVTLDDVERRLQAEDLVIADAERPVALAGIMGGADSEIDVGATRVLLEGALFDPRRVRRTAKRLLMHTDASHRFERGLPFDSMVAALDRCAEMIVEVAGGEIHEGRLDVAVEPPEPTVVRLRPERARRVLGADDVSDQRCRQLLEGLGFSVDGTHNGGDAEDPDGGALRVVVPAWRGDVTGEHDLVEEVGRHHGYDRLPSTLPVIRQPDAGGAPAAVVAERRLRRLCSSCGWWEALTYAFTAADDQTRFDAGVRLAHLANPLSAVMGSLRAWLVPGLVRALAHNHNHRRARAGLFELGRCFETADGDDAAVVERRHLALAAYGSAAVSHWSREERAVDLFDLKGTLETLSERMGWPDWRWESSDRSGLQPGTAAELAFADGTARGWAGKLDAATAEAMGLDVPAWVLEVDVEDLLERPAGVRDIAPLPRYPSSDRDLTLIVDRAVGYDRIEAELAGRSELPVAEFQLIDVYEGDDLPDDSRALTLRIVYRAHDRTLTAEEIEAAHEAIASHLEDRLSAHRR